MASLDDLIGDDRASGKPRRSPLQLRLMLAILLGLTLASLAAVAIAGTARAALQNPVLLALLAIFVLGTVGAIVFAVRISRREVQEQPLFLRPPDKRKRFETALVASCTLAAAILLVPAFMLFAGYDVAGLRPGAWVHFACFAVLVAIGPYGFYMSREAKRVRRLEARFPDFLRDIASSHKGGLTLSEAVQVSARGEYGPLSPEVRRMADQISWNVAFTEALARFADRVQTPLVRRAVALILQADKSGGSTTEVLLAAARDAREIKSLENERKLQMSLYSAVIYITFFVFLGVAAVLYAQFVPQLIASQDLANQQAEATGVQGLSNGGNLRLEDFQLFYFMAAIMQGLGDGVVAGMMGEGRAVLGLRHSFVMVVIAYATFVFLL